MPEDGNDVIADSVTAGDVTPDPTPSSQDPAAQQAVQDEVVDDVQRATPPEAAGAEKGILRKLFTEPAAKSPDELDGHDLVQLIKGKFGDLTKTPKQALEYLLKAGIGVLDKMGLPVGGRKNMPAGVYVIIGLIALVVSFFTPGDDEAGDGQPDQEPADVGEGYHDPRDTGDQGDLA